MKVLNGLYPSDQLAAADLRMHQKTYGVVCAVLMPHAPILVSEVGGRRGCAAVATCRAMRAAALCVTSHKPDTIVIISPHAPARPGAFGLWAEDPIKGTFELFNAPQSGVRMPLDHPLERAIKVQATLRDLRTWPIRGYPLDHGALVPLWFLDEVGWDGPAVVIGLSDVNAEGLEALGNAVADAARSLSRRVAIIASGDLSHCLSADAPCGFHPRARQFDETFIRMVDAGSYRKIEGIDPVLRGLAAEDAVDSTLVAAAAVSWNNASHRLLNYEGPFGVGYGVAILYEDSPGASGDLRDIASVTRRERPGATLPTIARRSVESALSENHEVPPLVLGEYLQSKHGVFVTIRQLAGAVRGCMGTIDPIAPNIVSETWRNARLAAFRDNRFSPVAQNEMSELVFEVSVLHELEPVSSIAELNPRHYGVVVSASDGRRGTLLPGIPEIVTSDEQVQIAKAKGGIGADEPVTMQRFRVDHFDE